MQGLIRRATTATLGAIVLLAATTAHAQLSEAQAEQLMKLSGGWSQLASMVPQMRESFDEGLAKADKDISEAVRQKAKAEATRTFTAERLRATARKTLAEGVRATYVPELLTWYQSAGGRRVTQAEERAAEEDSRSDQETRTRAGVEVLQAATAERRQVLLRVVEVTRAGPATTDVVINLGLAVASSMARLTGKAAPVSETQLRAELETQRPQMVRAFEGLALANAALVYKDLPDELVSAYVTFMAGAAGDHFNDLTNRAVEAALLDAFRAIGR
jgi:hypothetical protein